MISSAVVLWWFARVLTAGIGDIELRLVSAPCAVAAILFCLLMQVLRAWRFSIMAFGRLHLPSRGMIAISIILNMMNYLIPFRVGDLLFPLLMKRAYGQNLAIGAGVLLLARLVDLVTVLSIICTAAAFVHFPATAVRMPALILAVPIVAVLPYILVWVGHRGSIHHSVRERSSPMIHELAHSLRSLGTRGSILAVITLSYSIWLAAGVAAIFAVVAAGISIDASIVFLATAASNLAFALPINGIAGLGPSQAAWAAVVILAGHPQNVAVVGAIATYVASLASALIFGALASAIHGFPPFAGGKKTVH